MNSLLSRMPGLQIPASITPVNTSIAKGNGRGRGKAKQANAPAAQPTPEPPLEVMNGEDANIIGGLIGAVYAGRISLAVSVESVTGGFKMLLEHRCAAFADFGKASKPFVESAPLRKSVWDSMEKYGMDLVPVRDANGNVVNDDKGKPKMTKPTTEQKARKLDMVIRGWVRKAWLVIHPAPAKTPSQLLKAAEDALKRAQAKVDALRIAAK